MRNDSHSNSKATGRATRSGITVLFFVAVLLMGLGFTPTVSAAPARNQCARGVWSGGSSFTIRMISAPTNGDLMILVFGGEMNPSQGSAIVAGPISQNGVIWDASDANAISGLQIRNVGFSSADADIWLGVVGKDAGVTIIISVGWLPITGAPVAAIADVCEYSGLATASVLDQTASGLGGADTQPTGTTSNTTTADELWVGITWVWRNGTSSMAQSNPTNNFTLLDGVSTDFGRSRASLGYLEKIVSSRDVAGSEVQIANYKQDGIGVIATFKGGVATFPSTPTTTSQASYFVLILVVAGLVSLTVILRGKVISRLSNAELGQNVAKGVNLVKREVMDSSRVSA